MAEVEREDTMKAPLTDTAGAPSSRTLRHQESVARMVSRFQKATSSTNEDSSCALSFTILGVGLLFLGILGFIAVRFCLKVDGTIDIKWITAYTPFCVMEVLLAIESIKSLWGSKDRKPSAIEMLIAFVSLSYFAGDICMGYRLDGALDWKWTCLLLFHAFGSLTFLLSNPVVAILAFAQFILVGLQLDGFIHAHWAVVFIPVWLVCTFVIGFLVWVGFSTSFFIGVGSIVLGLAVVAPFPIAVYRIEGPHAFSTVYVILPWLIVGLLAVLGLAIWMCLSSDSPSQEETNPPSEDLVV
ncbi:hypothetical protein Ae201684P_010516 [Aphanomyces euteiches]|uniref:Transmembrane protein n=1 Tax=Aphanomyces euteiches TaxID=100861 RepID=A0A6G0WPG9_9STRA|nr:hypothetical protein Ae201684_013044 [Aphanomyces euteiches]KAH9076575.1 hypothetical protein Ae201684P_010516 [Aphanomyces euteiches]KAH9142272.1 hypothetical protein AeRB84_013648 [Aphanomyces euteiches]